MTVAASLIRTIRLMHLYVGVFIAPAVLFFAFTGALQTFSLHETNKGSDYRPAQWIVVLAQLHKKQTTELPVRRAPPSGMAARLEAQPNFSAALPGDARKVRDPMRMKYYFAIVSWGLVFSTFTGLYMAFKFTRNKAAIAAVLIAGIAAPALLLLTSGY